MSGLLPFLLVLLVVAFFTKVDTFFYLLYALFGVFFLGRLWARRALSSVEVERCHDSRIFLGETFPVQVRVRNRGLLPVLWLRLADNLPSDLTTGSTFRRVLSLMPREHVTLSYSLNGRRRGYYLLGPIVCVGGDLLGTVTYEDHHAGDDPVTVYPKIVGLRELGLPSQSPFGTLASRERIFEDPTRIRGVRDYQRGDSLRRIDWKTSARVGELQVRRYEPAIALDTVICVNLNLDDYVQRYRRQATELGIVIAASMAVHLVEKRQAVGLITNGRDPLREAEADAAPLTLAPGLNPRKGREHLLHLLDLLARIKAVPEADSAPWLDLLIQKSQRLPWGSTVVVVTSQEADGLMDTLLALRRRGLVVILVSTCPHRDFALTVQRARQIGVQAIRVWTEQEMDVWR